MLGACRTHSMWISESQDAMVAAMTGFEIAAACALKGVIFSVWSALSPAESPPVRQSGTDAGAKHAPEATCLPPLAAHEIPIGLRTVHEVVQRR